MKRNHGRARAVTAAVAVAVGMTGLSSMPAAADDIAQLSEMLDLTRPELAAVAARLADGDEAGAAEELVEFYAGRTGIEFPAPSGGGAGDATADELAAGIFRFGAETRDFYDDEAQRIDVDWEDTWGGTEEIPGGARVLMTDLSFMPTLVYAYLNETDPQRRQAYAAAWMQISLDLFADVTTWPTNRNLLAAKRLAQLVSAFAVFRAEPTLDAGDLVSYLVGVHATTDRLTVVLPRHGGNNQYLSIARSIYYTAVYFPEFSASFVWEPSAARSVEWFVGRHIKSDSVYSEPTVNYQAYAADLLNGVVRMAELNGRSLPGSIARASDWIADSLFATRMPNLQAALVGDAKTPHAGIHAIGTSGERNEWSDFAWVASGRTEGTEPTLGSTMYPISFAVQRSGWDADARYLLINNQNTSYTASHRHPDDLSVVMAAYGRPLIVDPGAHEYSATPTNDWMRKTTEAHNTVEVDGLPQAAGVTRATWLWRSNDGLDVYRGEALGYDPVSHDRVVYFVKPGFWIVSDSLTGDTAAHDYRQLWHFPGDPVVVDPSTQVATVGFDTVPGADPVAGVQLVPVAAGGAGLTPNIHDHGAVQLEDSELLTDVDFLSYDWSATGATGVDTVVFPGEAGPAPTVSATRIDLPGVDHSVATAMQIELPDSVGRFYLSREDTPTPRTFGTATTDGETAYIERGDDRHLTRYALTSGTSLVDGREPLLEASGTVSDINVELAGTTATISLGDPFTGTITLRAPDAGVVIVNNEPVTFTRTKDVITITLEESFDLETVLTDEFDADSLSSTVHDFDDASFGSWWPVEGDWAIGSQAGGALAQTSTADIQAFAVHQDVPTDLVMSAEVEPGAGGSATTRTGLAFRYRDSRNYYRANLLNTREGVTLQIIKVYNGELDVLAERSVPLDPGAAHTMTISAVGSHLTATVGDTSISVDDTRLSNGGVAAYTHRRAAIFDNVTIAEALDQEHWQGISGDVSVDSGELHIVPTGGRAHVLVASTLPARFSETCDYDVSTTLTLSGVGTAGVSLRDSTDSYGYRMHVGKTSHGTRYASIIREAHRSGPVTVATTPLDDPLVEPVDLDASVHGDLITVTVNGVQVLQARDTVVRSGGVGVYATSSEATFSRLSIAQTCGHEPPDLTPAPQVWEPDAVYDEGDLVSDGNATWVASWWTQNQQPGDPDGPWQEVAVGNGGASSWTASRIFDAGDVVVHESARYQAAWWTRDDVPGDGDGPWVLLE